MVNHRSSLGFYTKETGSILSHNSLGTSYCPNPMDQNLAETECTHHGAEQEVPPCLARGGQSGTGL